MAKPKGATPKTPPSSMSFFAAMLVGAVLTLGIVLFVYLWNPFKSPVKNTIQTTSVQPKEQSPASAVSYEFYDLLKQQQVSGLPNDVVASQPVVINTKPDVIVTANTQNKTESSNKDNKTDTDKSEKVSTVTNPMDDDQTESTTVAMTDSQSTADNTAQSKLTERDRIAIKNATPDRTYILQINSFDNADEADKRRAEVLMAGVDAQIVKKRLNDDRIIYQVISRVMPSAQMAGEAQRRLQTSGIDSLIVEQRH